MYINLDSIDIPSYASRIDADPSSLGTRQSTKVATTPPKSSPGLVSPPSPQQSPPTPSKQPLNISSAILASGLSIPSPSPRNSRRVGGRVGADANLLSTREPLSLPATTTHFRRFAAKSGPIFWFQDRVEEVLMWKRGQKVTLAWMGVVAFLCYFPRLVLLVPHAILLSILLMAHSVRQPSLSRSVEAPAPPPYTQPAEGSPEWFSNLQAIQNLMGAVSDAHDFILHTLVPHLTFSTPYTYTLLVCTLLSLLLFLPLLPFLPLRALALLLLWTPFLLLHPLARTYLPALLAPYIKKARVGVARIVDDDRLEDRHFRSELREVELWENERYGFGGGGSGGGKEKEGGKERAFGKAVLRNGERKAWTRGRDGWSDEGPGGNGDVSSNLTFTLSPGWAFVETEDWRKDLEASWTEVDSDADGWVYTNGAWMDPHSAPLEEWLRAGEATRRRRWVRRIYRQLEEGVKSS